MNRKAQAVTLQLENKIEGPELFDLKTNKQIENKPNQNTTKKLNVKA